MRFALYGFGPGAIIAYSAIELWFRWRESSVSVAFDAWRLRRQLKRSRR